MLPTSAMNEHVAALIRIALTGEICGLYRASDLTRTHADRSAHDLDQIIRKEVETVAQGSHANADRMLVLNKQDNM